MIYAPRYGTPGHQDRQAWSGVKLGYACAWWRPVETTWSGTSASLMASLAARPGLDLTPIAAQRNLLTGGALVAMGRARGYGTWKHQPMNRRLTDYRVRRSVARSDLDALLAVGDVEPRLDLPTFLYQDANFSTIRAHREVLHEHASSMAHFPSGRLDELIDQQRVAYQSAEVVLSFSKWFADWLVEHDGLSRDRVRVVGAGLHVLPERRDLLTCESGGTRVLFVGREFSRKGGELVVAAVERLRATGSGEFTLTIVGPARWPLPGAIPDWVEFRGELPAADVSRMWSQHDLFALPTWYEPYGLVFLEARAAGVPILARDAYCMPELVPEGSGRLIPADGGVDAVAEHLLAMSRDEELFVSAADAAAATRSQSTWDAVTDRVVHAIQSALTGR